MICSLSKLTEKELKEINRLETEIKTPVLAFSCYDIQSAILTDEALAKVETLEKKLGISLVAVRS